MFRGTGLLPCLCLEIVGPLGNSDTQELQVMSTRRETKKRGVEREVWFDFLPSCLHWLLVVTTSRVQADLEVAS